MVTPLTREVLQNEFYGLNPFRGYFWTRTLQKTRVFTTFGAACGFAAEVIPTLLTGFFFAMDRPDKIRTVGEIAKHHYQKRACDLSTTIQWADTQIFSPTELKAAQGSKYLDEYLRSTAGRVRIRAVPSPHKILSPSGGHFVTGGIFARCVDLELSFYAEDKNGGRAYLGLENTLCDAWLHILAAGDHKEAVECGVQLDRQFELTQSYVVQHIAFPREGLAFGPAAYPLVHRERVRELAQSTLRQASKDRVFRAICEMGMVY